MKALGTETWGIIRALLPAMTDPSEIASRVEAICLCRTRS